MNKNTQRIVTVLVDMILLAIIVVASYFLFRGPAQIWKQRLLQIAIIIVIPVGFYLTYQSFFSDKYDFEHDFDAQFDAEEESQEDTKI